MPAIIHTPKQNTFVCLWSAHKTVQSSKTVQTLKFLGIYLIWFLSSHHHIHHYLTIFIKSPFNLIYQITNICTQLIRLLLPTWVTWATTKLSVAIRHQGAEDSNWTPKNFMFLGYARGSTSFLGSLIIGNSHMVRLFNFLRKWFAEEVASKATTIVEEVWWGRKKSRAKMIVEWDLVVGQILSMLKPLQIAWNSLNEHLFHLWTKVKTQLTIFKIEETHDTAFL